MKVVEHTPAMCDCKPTSDVSGCQFGYAYVIQRDDGTVFAGGFVYLQDALMAMQRWSA